MTIVAHSRSFVIGVDTHAKTHTHAIIDPMGQMLGCEQFPTTAQGVARAIAWVGRRTTGQADALWMIECVATAALPLDEARLRRPPAPMRACAKPCGCWWPPATR